MFSKQDFLRQLPQRGSHAFARRESLSARLNIDLVMLGLLLMLITMGMFVLYSASGQDISVLKRQGISLFIGVICMIVIAQIHPRHFNSWAVWGYLAGIACLVGVIVAGVEAKGAQRWLAIGSVRFQPSEIMKIAVPMTVAWFVTKRQIPPRFFHMIGCLLIIFVPVLLIVKQPDLGTSILIATSGLLVILFAGISLWIVGAFLLFVISMIPIMWIFVMHPYQKQRVKTFLDPESDPRGAGWNIIQSKTAIGSGGVEGKGWLNSTQSYLEFLPESHTDFIIAVFAEEFGFVGILGLLFLYACIIARGLYISVQAKDVFGKLLAGTLTVTFFVYVFVNIGMVSGLLPVVGVPLPLVSYGGTSSISLLAAFGIIMSIHTHKKV